MGAHFPGLRAGLTHSSPPGSGPRPRRHANFVLQSLFGYHPRQWYRIPRHSSYPSPPKLEHASPAALERMLEVAERGLTLDISDVTREDIKAKREEIEKEKKRRERMYFMYHQRRFDSDANGK